MCYLQMNTHSHTTKMITLPSFLRHKLKMLSKCCVFKLRQYIHLIFGLAAGILLFLRIYFLSIIRHRSSDVQNGTQRLN